MPSPRIFITTSNKKTKKNAKFIFSRMLFSLSSYGYLSEAKTRVFAMITIGIKY